MVPIFIKGQLRFTIEAGGMERELLFENQNISTWGVAGLPWGPLSPEVHFGRVVEAFVEIPTGGMSFRAEALITRESTRVGQHMGLKFKLQPEDASRLASLIRDSGFFPTEYLRKYPRIPSLPMLQTFPLRAIALADHHGESLPITFDVENLSPNGVLLSSENQQTLAIQPGALLNLILEPRGWFPMPVSAQGMVCRVSDGLSPLTGNLSRTLGIKFTRIDEANRAAFVDLLKDILERFKALEKPGASPVVRKS